jgi:hypothetical protein
VLDAGIYPGSILMAHRIQSVLGYHGNEVRFYDDLLGGKNIWRNLGNPNLHDLLAVRFLILPDSQEVPGYHPITERLAAGTGSTGVIYERDAPAEYVRVLPSAAKLPEDQVVPTIVDPRFPRSTVVLFTDTASVTPAPIQAGRADTVAIRAQLTEWAPGRMRIALEGRDERPRYLLVSETWYKDWHARIDGEPAPVYRGNHALITLVIPPGAREVALEFSSPEYVRGKILSLIALLTILGLFAYAYRARRGAARV